MLRQVLLLADEVLDLAVIMFSEYRTKIIITVAMVIAITAGGPAHSSYETGGVTKVILNNGLTLLVRPEPQANVVAIEVFVRIGAADEGESNAGIGQLLAGSILAGTKSRSAPRLARLFSEVGGNFNAVWHWNYLEVYAVTTPSGYEEAIALLADSIQRPQLDRAVVDYAKTAVINEARRQDQDPLHRAYAALRQEVHRGTPYDRSYYGDPDKIRAISRDDVDRFHKRNISADRVVISVVGNVNVDRVIRKVDVCFGHMTRSTGSVHRNARTSSGNGRFMVDRSPTATYILLGYLAAGVDDPDYAAMSIANVLLGGNKSSLMFSKLREERGLGYQVGSMYPPLQGESHIVAYLGMDSSRATPDNLDTIQESVLQQINTLRSGGFSDDDFERAKRFLIGSHALRRERTRDRAFYLGWHETVGLGYQYDFQFAEKIRQVTREDVEAACNRFFRDPVSVVLSDTQSDSQ